jgi:hypothetical protein
MVNSKHFTQCYIRPWGDYSCHQYWQRIALRSVLARACQPHTDAQRSQNAGLKRRPFPAPTDDSATNDCAAADQTVVSDAHGLGGDCTGVGLVDAYFIVVSLPAIAVRPEQRELHRSTLIAVDGDIGEFNSDFSRS